MPLFKLWPPLVYVVLGSCRDLAVGHVSIASLIFGIQRKQIQRTTAIQREREIVGVIGCPGETCVLAEFLGTGWSLMGSHWSLQLEKKPSQNGHIFELRGDRLVKFLHGRKLEYEAKKYERQKNEQDFMTAVEFSAKYRYGKSIALFNLKSGLLKAHKYFVEFISKAYQALTDPISCENFEKYGHPDGRQRLQMGIALPQFL